MVRPIDLSADSKIRLFNPINVESDMFKTALSKLLEKIFPKIFQYKKNRDMCNSWVLQSNLLELSVEQNPTLDTKILFCVFEEFREYMNFGGTTYINSVLSDSTVSDMDKLNYQRLLDLYHWWNCRRTESFETIFEKYNEDTNNLLRLISLRSILSK